MVDSRLEDRLAEVDGLRARGVLTAAEHAERRQVVLNSVSAPQRAAGGTAVLVLTVTGAALGVMFGFFAIAVGGIGNDLDDGSGNQTIGLGLSAVAAVVVSVVLAGLYASGHNRTSASWGLTGAANWHLVSISVFGVPGFAFLALGAVFAWTGRDG